MIIYYIAILSIVIAGIYFGERTNKKTILFFYGLFVAILLTCIASFRYGIGFDYFSYESIYESIQTTSTREYFALNKTEPLFYLFCKILSLCNFSYTGFIFLTSLIFQTIIIFFIIGYSKIPWLSAYLYVTLQFFAYTMNLTRQSIALCFFLFAFHFLKTRKLLPFLTIIIIGSMFHNSLVYMIPLYILLPLQQTVFSYSVLGSMTAFFYLFSEPVLNWIKPFLFPKYREQLSTLFSQPSRIEYLIFPLLYVLLAFTFCKLLYKNSKNATIYLNSALYTFIISIFITKHFILERFSIYPFSLSLLLIPEIVACAKKKSKQYYHIVLFLFLLYGFLYFLFASQKGFHNVYPYYSLFSKSISTGVQ